MLKTISGLMVTFSGLMVTLFGLVLTFGSLIYGTLRFDTAEDEVTRTRWWGIRILGFVFGIIITIGGVYVLVEL